MASAAYVWGRHILTYRNHSGIASRGHIMPTKHKNLTLLKGNKKKETFRRDFMKLRNRNYGNF